MPALQARVAHAPAWPAVWHCRLRTGATVTVAPVPMTIRIDLVFPAALDRDAQSRLLLAAAALPEVRRCVLAPDRRRATWYACELPRARVQEALRAAGLEPAGIGTTLAPEAEAQLAAAGQAPYRPPGR